MSRTKKPATKAKLPVRRVKLNFEEVYLLLVAVRCERDRHAIMQARQDLEASQRDGHRVLAMQLGALHDRLTGLAQ